MTRPKPEASTTARHRTDVVSLLFGLLFVGVAGWWAASYYLDWVINWELVPDAGWVLAAGLILLGLIGIAASLRRDRKDAPPAAIQTGADETGTAGRLATAESLDEPETVRPDEPTAELDWPAANDPGGHRPA
jgi:hypothetical protein